MSKPVKILASARSEATQNAIKSALGSVSGVRLEMRNGALTDLLEDKLLDRRSQMMILDVDLQNDSELNTLNQVIEQVPSGLPIIVTANSAEVDRVRLLMRMGLADFIPQPIVEEDLLNSVEVAGRQLERSGLLEHSGGHVISFSRRPPPSSTGRLQGDQSGLHRQAERPDRGSHHPDHRRQLQFRRPGPLRLHQHEHAGVPDHHHQRRLQRQFPARAGSREGREEEGCIRTCVFVIATNRN